MSKLTYEEARAIATHSIDWLCDINKEHDDAIQAVVGMCMDNKEFGRYICAILGFAVGRAWGVREERERRRVKHRKEGRA